MQRFNLDFLESEINLYFFPEATIPFFGRKGKAVFSEGNGGVFFEQNENYIVFLKEDLGLESLVSKQNELFSQTPAFYESKVTGKDFVDTLVNAKFSRTNELKNLFDNIESNVQKDTCQIARYSPIGETRIHIPSEIVESSYAV